MLLARLQGKPVCRVAVSVDADSDQSPWHRALEAGPNRHVARMRTAEAHGDAETLAASHDDVGSPLPRRGGQGQRKQVGRRGDKCADLMCGH